MFGEAPPRPSGVRYGVHRVSTAIPDQIRIDQRAVCVYRARVMKLSSQIAGRPGAPEALSMMRLCSLVIAGLALILSVSPSRGQSLNPTGSDEHYNTAGGFAA